MNHDELRKLIPLLALDALPAAEEEEVVSHVKVCRECSELLAGHEMTTGSLGLAVAPVLPSPQLKERLLSEARRTQQFPPERLLPAIRPHRRTGTRVAAALAMAAVFVFGFVGARELMVRNDRLAEQQDLLAAQRRALEVASSEGALVLPLRPSSGFGDVSGKVVVAGDKKSTSVLLAGLDDPGESVYTLWLSPEGGSPRNVADFVPDDGGRAVVNLNTAVPAKETVAVTREPRRGLTSPTGPLIATAVRA